jgi:hypothetical protein
MRRIGAGHHGLGRGAAGIDAGPAEELALDDRDLLPRLGQPPCQGRPRLAGADDDGVEIRHRSLPPICGAVGIQSGLLSIVIPAKAGIQGHMIGSLPHTPARLSPG